MAELRDALTLVLLTYNCGRWIDRTLQRAVALGVPVIAVDNASLDDTRRKIEAYPDVRLIALPRNIGAAGRNRGVDAARTRYVACCDDDGSYDRAGLQFAVDALDSHPSLALVNARIVVGDERALDPISIEMAASPLHEDDDLPGTVLCSFMGGACVVRVTAYQQVGGYDDRFFIGGEEETLGWPLIRRGWQLRYLPDVLMQHHPSVANATNIRHFGVRNTLWNCWLHRPWRSALRYSAFIIASTPKDRALLVGLLMAVRGLPWVLRERDPIGDTLDHRLRILEERRFAAWRAHRAAAGSHAARRAAVRTSPKYPVPDAQVAPDEVREDLP